jgi:hypothetical protein
MAKMNWDRVKRKKDRTSNDYKPRFKPKKCTDKQKELMKSLGISFTNDMHCITASNKISQKLEESRTKTVK